MNFKLVGVLVSAMTIAVLTGCGGPSSLVPGQTAQDSSVPARGVQTPSIIRDVERELRTGCGPAAPGHFQCYLRAPNAFFHTVGANAESDHTCTIDQPPCYGPAVLQSAYNLTSEAANGGKRVTVAVVDAYGYPTVKKDLDLYRKDLLLPKLCRNCFQVIDQSGGSKPPIGSNGSWDAEQALDLDMISAICPNCHILLVEAKDDTGTNLLQAVATALKKADVVSNSWGSGEWAASSALFDKHPGHVIVAAAGDDGYGALQPCSFIGVVCVGGTSLSPSKTVRGWSEVVWDATGSGCSADVRKPVWQSDKGCTMRSESDVSANADPGTGVVIAFKGVCCYGAVGGTSEATPLIAAMVALAGNAKSAIPARLWAHGGTTAFNAVTKGSNGTCPSAIEYICTAGTKMNGVYSGPAGWGTPNGPSAL